MLHLHYHTVLVYSTTTIDLSVAASSGYLRCHPVTWQISTTSQLHFGEYM